MTKKIIVETSARHIHLSDADLETLRELKRILR